MFRYLGNLISVCSQKNLYSSEMFYMCLTKYSQDEPSQGEPYFVRLKVIFYSGSIYLQLKYSSVFPWFLESNINDTYFYLTFPVSSPRVMSFGWHRISYWQMVVCLSWKIVINHFNCLLNCKSELGKHHSWT